MDINKCLFCYQENNLIENIKCSCKFYYHNECYIKWMQHKKGIICPICKKNLEIQELITDLQPVTFYKRFLNYATIIFFFILSGSITIIILYLFFKHAFRIRVDDGNSDN